MKITYLQEFLSSFFTSVIMVGENGIIEFINNKSEILFGYKNEEVIGKDINIFVPDHLKELHSKYVHNAEFASYRMHVMGKERNVTAQKKTGEIFELEIYVNAFKLDDNNKLLLFCNEIESKKTNILKNLESFSETGSWEWNIETDTIIWSDEMKKIFHSETPINFNDSLKNIHKDDLDMVKKVLQNTIVSQYPYDLVYRQTIDGKLRYIYSKCKTVIENNKIIKLIGFSQDITDNKSMKNELDVTKNILNHVSHEIKSPLYNIINVCSFLEETMLEEKQEEFVRLISETINTLLIIVNNTLDISKLSSGKLHIKKYPFEIRKIIPNIFKNYYLYAIKNSIDLTLNIDDNVPDYINGDVIKIQQILNNLLSNAIKYTDKGFIHVNIYLQNKDIRFDIKDSGCGISQDDKEKLFKPFNQINFSSDGTGLGLCISKELVELMSGKIDFESNKVGSTFWFSFPIN